MNLRLLTSGMAILFGVIGSTTGFAEVFRISEVSEKAGAGVEALVLDRGETPETLFVKKEAVLTEDQVKEAFVTLMDRPGIEVRLTEEGSARLESVTQRLRPGDRLAIVIEGRLIMAPVLHGPLSDSFVISGPSLGDNDELRALARRMSGQNAADEKAMPLKIKEIPAPERVPYTDAEFEGLQAMREKAGQFYLDQLPSESDLNASIRKGMTRDEVIAILGKPTYDRSPTSGETFDLDYMVAFERLPENPDREMRHVGVTVQFRKGVVSEWSWTSSDMPRSEKRVRSEPPSLRVIHPETNPEEGREGMIAFFEDIQVPDPFQSVNEGDLWDLLSITLSTCGAFQGEDGTKFAVDADCDLMRVLAHHFPEVAELRDHAGGGYVTIGDLEQAVMPYADGAKPLPAVLKDEDESNESN